MWKLIDEERNITHSDFADQTEEILLDEAKYTRLKFPADVSFLLRTSSVSCVYEKWARVKLILCGKITDSVGRHREPWMVLHPHHPKWRRLWSEDLSRVERQGVACRNNYLFTRCPLPVLLFQHWTHFPHRPQQAAGEELYLFVGCSTQDPRCYERRH